MASPHFENSLACVVLALFHAQIPIWETKDYAAIVEQLRLTSTASGTGLSINEEQALLLQIWWELNALNSWVFPQAPEWLTCETPQLNSTYLVNKISAFLQKVDGELFPLDIDLVDHFDLESLLWALREIPVMPLGYSTDSDIDDPSNYAEPIPTLLTLFGYELGLEDENRADWKAPVSIQMPRIPISDLADTLRQMHELPKVLSVGLPHLLDSITRNTGNIWLDCSYADIAVGEVGLERWHPETVRFYAAQWREAEPIFDSTMALVDWVKQDAEQCMNHIFRVLTAARIVKDKEKQ